MTATAALHAFFNGFGIPAYLETNVPENAALPYLTYNAPLSYFGGASTACTVNLWYQTDSDAEINAKAAEMAKIIGYNGITVPAENGYIYVKRGSPWCQPFPMENPQIKRRLINITIDYLL